MNYKKNEAGDVMVRTEKGVPKYVSQKLAEDAQLMKAMHLTVVQAPVPFCEELKTEHEEIVTEHEEINTDLTQVAETTPAKRGRKPNQK